MIVWLASYPRSGNTFFRVILNTVFEIQTYSIYNDRDIGSDQETSDIVGHKTLTAGFDLKNMRKSNHTYYIKTHELFDEKIDSNDKVVYLIRDGRESSLSFTKHQNIYGKKNKTLIDTIYGDTWIGGWGEHVKSWEKFPQDKMLYIYFEALTESPTAQLENIAKFLNIKAINKRIPTFEELKATNPKFFRNGKKDSWKTAYSHEEHMAFWYKYSDSMKKYGYINLIPEIFKSQDLDLLYKAVKTDNTYKKLHNSDNEQEVEIKVLETANITQNKELCARTKKLEAIEKKLNNINAEVKQLMNIKFFKNPIEKYKAYKKMLLHYRDSINTPYLSKKTLVLPTDDIYKAPNKEYCIFEDENPILIYQVGKVGSSAIYMSLKEQIRNLPIYQVHNIATAQALLNKDLEEDTKNGIGHFTMGINLKKKIAQEPNIRWKIIIGVREPISRWVSDVFENIHTRYKFLKNSDDSIDVEKTIQFIKDTLNEEPQEKWFNDELLATFGVYLFDKPFNGNYQISHYEKIDILMYKFENMQEHIPTAIKDFLNLKNFNLITANATSQKSTAAAYKDVKRKLKFDRVFLEKLYSKDVVKHIYTDKEIESFKALWINHA